MRKEHQNTTDALLVEVLRGEIVESRHRVSLALVDTSARQLLAFGTIDHPIYLRSSAKPFQALPLIETCAEDESGLSSRQLAIICASHSGADEHVAVVREIHGAAGLNEDHLQCGVHTPFDRITSERLIERGELLSPLRHNCSGKHTGMLLCALALKADLDTYLQPSHEVQRAILKAFSEMVAVAEQEVELGTDGCSAPNFAVPLPAAALGYARLLDPAPLPEARARACGRITQAMLAHPELVAGHGRFDTAIMQATQGRLLAKGGAEGYQAIGIPPGQILDAALGLTLKVHDGDGSRRARSVATLAVLKACDLLSGQELAQLTAFDGRRLTNFRQLDTGSIRLSPESQARLQTAYDRI